MSMQDSTDKEKKGEGLIFCTWNVNRVNEPVKRGKVLSHLKAIQADVIFLQETHLENDAHNKLKCRWISQLYHSKFSAKARGAAILIRNRVPFKHQSTIQDKGGRYVMVMGEMYSTPMTLLNIYGPNYDDPEFFRKVLGLILDISNTNLIIWGDFNLVLDPYLDRSNTQKVSYSNAGNLIKTYMDNMNLCESVWRLLNPTGKEYFFHSRVHNVYSRIDYFLVDGKILPSIQNTKYHNIITSDHCPVSFLMKRCDSSGVQRNWRFDPQLLDNPKFCEYLKSQIAKFFEINDNNETSDTVLWETFKAYVRGCIISFQSSQKKRDKAEQLELEKQISNLDAENAQQPSMEKYKTITSLKY